MSLIVVQAAFVQVTSVAAIDAEPPVVDEAVPVVDGPKPAALADITIPPGGPGTDADLDPSIGLRQPPVTAGPPDEASEIISARTEHSRQIANPDGTVTLQSSAGRLNFLDPSTGWQPIDLDLVDDASGLYGLRTAANDRVVRVAADGGTDAIAELSADGRTLRIRAPRGPAAAPTVDARHGVDRLDYEALEDGPGLYVRPTTEGVEFGATWSDGNGAPFVDVVLQLEGYAARLAADGVSIELVEVALPGVVPIELVPSPSPIAISEPLPSPSAGSTPESVPSADPLASELPAFLGIPPALLAESPAASPEASATPAPSDAPPSGSPAPLPTPAPSPPPTLAPTAEPPASPSLSASLPPSSEPTPVPTPEPTPLPVPTATAIPIPAPNAPVIGRIEPPTILEGIDGLPADAPVIVTVLPGPALNEVRLRYAIDPAWLAAPERAFPIVLDPTICIQAGGSGCASSQGIETYVGEGQPDTYPTSPSVLRVGDDDITADVEWNTLRSLVYFDHQVLPDGAIVTAATLRLRQTSNYDNSLTPQIYARPMQHQWSNQATWNEVWGDHRQGFDSPIVTPCASDQADCDLTLDVEAAVRLAYTRRAKAWKTDNGFQVLIANESDAVDEVDFDVSSGCSTICPQLTISYQAPHVGIDFDPLLGTTYAPSTMLAGDSTKLPIIVANQGSGWDFGVGTYGIGYRWFDAKGNYKVTPTAPMTLPGCIGPGAGCSASEGPFALPVTAPADPGIYTLRLDLARLDGSTYLWASDLASLTGAP